MDKQKQPEKSSVNLGRELSKINIVSNFGFTIIGNIVVGIILGLFFDNLFGTKKLFLIILTFLGTASGLYNGIRYILKEVEKYEREEKKK
uniref:AtpZ/AtpI family protein n=1 Tax=Fervidobacterium nodosum TaxID=2424 RepID=A0A7C5U620_9BACT